MPIRQPGSAPKSFTTFRPSEPSPQHDHPLSVDSVNLENLLRQVETDRGNLHFGRLLPSVGVNTDHSGTQMPLRGRPHHQVTLNANCVAKTGRRLKRPRCLCCQKSLGGLLQGRGRMTRLEGRQTLMCDIAQACAEGARLGPACVCRADADRPVRSHALHRIGNEPRFARHRRRGSHPKIPTIASAPGGQERNNGCCSNPVLRTTRRPSSSLLHSYPA